MPRPGDDTQIVHGSCVALNGQAVLIVGASGSGKSGLALQLMALGAQLVADDRTRLWSCDTGLMADAPPAIRGQIEARGVGILAAGPAGPATIRLVVDMDHMETERLPKAHDTQILGVTLPRIKKSDAAHFPAAVLLYLRGERLA